MDCRGRGTRWAIVPYLLSLASSFLSLFSSCPPSFKLLPRPLDCIGIMTTKRYVGRYIDTCMCNEEENTASVNHLLSLFLFLQVHTYFLQQALDYRECLQKSS